MAPRNSSIKTLQAECWQTAEDHGFHTRSLGPYGIDLEEIMLQKMAFNKTRPYLHGKTM